SAAPSRACCGRARAPRRKRCVDWNRQYDPAEPGRGERVAVAQQTFEQLTSAGLDQLDPEIADLLGRETERQRNQIELIASENFTWPAIMEAIGSTPTNKY